jgi:hypothetical protein
LTTYDLEHLITYLRLLDADAEGAHWREVARVVLHLDPEREFDRARRAFESHLARAKWMTEHGYRHLLRARRKRPRCGCAAQKRDEAAAPHGDASSSRPGTITTVLASERCCAIQQNRLSNGRVGSKAVRKQRWRQVRSSLNTGQSPTAVACRFRAHKETHAPQQSASQKNRAGKRLGKAAQKHF